LDFSGGCLVDDRKMSTGPNSASSATSSPPGPNNMQQLDQSLQSLFAAATDYSIAEMEQADAIAVAQSLGLGSLSALVGNSSGSSSSSSSRSSSGKSSLSPAQARQHDTATRQKLQQVAVGLQRFEQQCDQLVMEMEVRQHYQQQ
jgi:hypothetical protein